MSDGIANFTLTRLSQTALSTIGILKGADSLDMCSVLERGPSNPEHPRIPAGVYEIGVRTGFVSKFDGTLRTLLGDVYKGILWLPDVPGRENIEIHPANTFDQLLGCLAPGLTYGVDPLGEFCVYQSRAAYKQIYPVIVEAVLNGRAQLTITDPEGA